MDGTSGTSGADGTSGTSGADGSATINNNANNRLITGSDTPGTLEGETDLTYDGTNLSVKGINIGLGASAVASNILIGASNNLPAITTGARNLVISAQQNLAVNATGNNNIILNQGPFGSLNSTPGPNGNISIGHSNFTGATGTIDGNTLIGNSIAANYVLGPFTGNIVLGGGTWNRGGTASSNIMIGAAIGGANATGINSNSSIFMGGSVANNAVGATFSNATIIGPAAMQNASGSAATGSVLIGQNVGQARNARYNNAIIMGAGAALAASGATFSNATVIGSVAGRNLTGTTVDSSILLGNGVAQTAVNATFANATLIGQNVVQNASGTNLNSTVIIGSNTAQNATGGSFINAIFIGANSGSNATGDNSDSFVLGSNSARFGGHKSSVILGSYAHVGVTGSSLQNNIAIGQNAGEVNNSNNNIFIGSAAGQNLTGGTGKHTIIGYNTGLGLTGGTANTILGSNISGLTGDLSNNILLSDGDGNVRLQFDGATAGYVYTPFVPKKDTAANINSIASPVAGMIMYDTTNNTLDLYNGSSWQPVSTTSVSNYGFFAYTGSTLSISNTAAAIAMTSQAANGITVASTNQITFGATGTYKITINHYPGPDYAQNIWLRKNGSNITGTTTLLDAGDATDYSQGSWDHVATFNANDYIQVMIAGATGDLAAPAQTFGSPPPGWITTVSVNQVA